MNRRSIAVFVATLALLGCEDGLGPSILEEGDRAKENSAPSTDDRKSDEQHAPSESPATSAPEREQTNDDDPGDVEAKAGGNGDTTNDPPSSDPAGGDPAPAPGPPETSKSQMSYIFVAHPDDEFEAWSTVEHSSGNYHVFVLLTRGGHTGYCENPQNKPGMDQYAPTPRDSEACKENRVTSWHRFLNRAAAADPFLDVLDRDAPTVSDVDAVAGRYDAWVGENSARFIFDFPDGGLDPGDLLKANELVRSTKGVLLPDLPDYQAMAGSFWNANYPDCVKYDHDDHRAVHEAVWSNDLDTTVQRGRTCATDPDAVYFRRMSDATWRQLAGAPDFLERGGEPGIFRQSYGWLSTAWKMSEDESTFNSRNQSFWQREF